MKRVTTKFVPNMLAVVQKQSSNDACRKLKEYWEIYPDLLIKVDRSWYYTYEPEKKQSQANRRVQIHSK